MRGVQPVVFKAIAKLFSRKRQTSTTQFGAHFLDTLFAPGISSFNNAVIPDLAGECPQARFWISNLFLNSLMGPRYNNAWKQAAVTFLFRTQIALRSYAEARAKP